MNLEDLERFWMKEWSLISCQVISNIIRYYRRYFRAVKLAYRACSSMIHFIKAQYTNACSFIGKNVVYIANYATILICSV